MDMNSMSAVLVLFKVCICRPICICVTFQCILDVHILHSFVFQCLVFELFTFSPFQVILYFIKYHL